MTISAELQARYSSEVDVDWWEALILSHPAAGSYYLCNTPEPMQGIIDRSLQTFLPVPFDAKLPSRDGEGQQDLQIAVCNVGAEMSAAIEAAITQPEIAIRCRYTVYIVGDTAPQYDPPFELSLTDVVLTESQLTGTATRADVINRRFPSVLYRPSTYPGLSRR